MSTNSVEDGPVQNGSGVAVEADAGFRGNGQRVQTESSAAGMRDVEDDPRPNKGQAGGHGKKGVAEGDQTLALSALGATTVMPHVNPT